jgi:uncharacterized membrane protein
MGYESANLIAHLVYALLAFAFIPLFEHKLFLKIFAFFAAFYSTARIMCAKKVLHR